MSTSDTSPESSVANPPTSVFGTVKKLGPGLIIAGSIVGSGELIATTKVGAEAGIALLWIILIGCVIKVFVQVELGRYTISRGKSTLAALDTIPGPYLRVRWIVWYWLVMFLASLGQLGGIVGGVGQALAISFPFTKGDYADVVQIPSAKELEEYLKWDRDRASNSPELNELGERERERIERGHELLGARIRSLGQKGEDALNAVQKIVDLRNSLSEARESGDQQAIVQLQSRFDSQVADANSLISPQTNDDRWWALIVCVITIALLYHGKYNMIQLISTAFVVSFTFITIGNVVSLQLSEQFRISIDQFWEGISFRLRSETGQMGEPVFTALKTFGIIGVGASELVAYPYWCLEKGYARFTGPSSPDQSWADRAKGWIRVMQWDCWLSMVIYTIATLAFFVMGVAVLHNEGRNPEGMRMVSTLAAAYVPVFGEYARWLFLCGAIAVLYSTFLVAFASLSRIFADWFYVARLIPGANPQVRDKLVSGFCVVLPLISLATYWTGADPVHLVLTSGLMQSLMLPMLGFAALYFRYAQSDSRLIPGRLWDALLVVSCIGLLLAGGYAGIKQVNQFLGG